MNCKNCNTEVHSNYCPECGQPTRLRRIDGQYIFDEMHHLLLVERGFFYTVKELLIRPGQTIRHYFTENRSRLVKPITFILVTSVLYTLCNHYFQFEDDYVRYSDAAKSTSTEIFKWIQTHYGYSNIIMGLFIGLWIKLLFRKQAYHFFEILILLCFVMGIGMLLFTIFGIVQGLTGMKMMQMAGVAGFMYMARAIGQFFGQGKLLPYVKALFAYILGMLTFSLLAILTGMLIDLVIKP